MTRKLKFLLGALLPLVSAPAFAQLSGSVSVQGEYEPLVIETERLNTFPAGYRFELPASSLEYESAGVVTDFRPDLLTMGATGRLTDWPWKKRRGFFDGRLGSYLDSRVHAGYYIVADTANTLSADLKFRSTAYGDGYALPGPERVRLYEGSLALCYSGFFGSSHSVRANIEGDISAYSAGRRESALCAEAGYAFRFAGHSSVGVDVRGDFLFPHSVSRNYGVVAVTPAYRFADRRFTVKTGLDIALAYDATGASKGEKFGTVHFAPDVTVQTRINRGIGVVLSATGGVMPSTMRLQSEADPFWSPWLFSPQPVYTPADLRGGVEIGPFGGFALSGAVRYALSHNVPLEAWQDFSFSDCRTARLHGFGVEADARYSWGSVVELGVTGSYTPQKGNRGIFNGFDRPRWVLEAEAAVRPVKKLKINVGYLYRGVRGYYEFAEGAWTSARMPDITDLRARISFSLLSNLDIYVRGQNLLNRRVELLPGYGSEGIAVSGGLYLEF